MARTYTIEPPPVAQPTGGVSGGGGVDNSGWQMLYQALGDLAAQGEQRRARKEEFKFRKEEQAKQHAHEKETTGTYAERTEKAEELATPAGRKRLDDKQLRKLAAESGAPPDVINSTLINPSLDWLAKNRIEPDMDRRLELRRKAVQKYDKIMGPQEAERAARYEEEYRQMLGAETALQRDAMQMSEAWKGQESRYMQLREEAYKKDVKDHNQIIATGRAAQNAGADDARAGLAALMVNSNLKGVLGGPAARTLPSMVYKDSTGQEVPLPAGGLAGSGWVPGQKFNEPVVEALVAGLPGQYPSLGEDQIKFMGDIMRLHYLGVPMPETQRPTGPEAGQPAYIPRTTPEQVYALRNHWSGHLAFGRKFLENTDILDQMESAGLLKADDPKIAELRGNLKLLHGDPLNRLAREAYNQVDLDLMKATNGYGAPLVAIRGAQAEMGLDLINETLLKSRSAPERREAFDRLLLKRQLGQMMSTIQRAERNGAPVSDTKGRLLDLQKFYPNLSTDLLKQYEDDPVRINEALGAEQARYLMSVNADVANDPRLQALAQKVEDVNTYIQTFGIDPNSREFPDEYRSVWQAIQNRYRELPQDVQGGAPATLPWGAGAGAGAGAGRGATTTPGAAIPPILEASPVAPAEGGGGSAPPLSMPSDEMGAEVSGMAAVNPAEVASSRVKYNPLMDPNDTFIDQLVEDPSSQPTDDSAVRRWMEENVSTDSIWKGIQKRGQEQFNKTKQSTGLGAGGNVMDMLPPQMQQAAAGQSPDQGTAPPAGQQAAGQPRARSPAQPAQPAPVPQPGPLPQPRPVSAAAPFAR